MFRADSFISEVLVFSPKLFLKVVMFVCAATTMYIESSPATIRHGVFSEILSTYVHDGSVNYKDLRNDKRLKDYIHWLAITNPDTLLDGKDKLAFWINAYNAYTLKIICDNSPVESINDLHSGGLVIGTVFKSTVWDKKLVTINGKSITLNTIEHEIVRPTFNDPRAHFALVCASKSCPALRNEAYEGSRLDAQLDDQGKKFFADNFRNEFDVATKKAHISKILSWYSGDFGDSDEGVLKFISRFLPPRLAEQINANPSAWDISYKDYDWSLNGK